MHPVDKAHCLLGFIFEKLTRARNAASEIQQTFERLQIACSNLLLQLLHSYVTAAVLGKAVTLGHQFASLVLVVCMEEISWIVRKPVALMEQGMPDKLQKFGLFARTIFLKVWLAIGKEPRIGHAQESLGVPVKWGANFFRPFHLRRIFPWLVQNKLPNLLLHSGFRQRCRQGGIGNVRPIGFLLGVHSSWISLLSYSVRLYRGKTLDKISVVLRISAQCLKINLNVLIVWMVLSQPLQCCQYLVCIGSQWYALTRSNQEDHRQVCWTGGQALGKLFKVLHHCQTVSLEESRALVDAVNLHHDKSSLDGALLYWREILQYQRNICAVHTVLNGKLAHQPRSPMVPGLYLTLWAFPGFLCQLDVKLQFVAVLTVGHLNAVHFCIHLEDALKYGIVG